MYGKFTYLKAWTGRPIKEPTVVGIEPCPLVPHLLTLLAFTIHINTEPNLSSKHNCNSNTIATVVSICPYVIPGKVLANLLRMIFVVGDFQKYIPLSLEPVSEEKTQESDS